MPRLRNLALAAAFLATPVGAQQDRPDYRRALAAGYKAAFLCSDLFNAGLPEAVVEQSIAVLAENAKVTAEGAGAAGLAAVLGFPALFAGKRVATAVCGGNIDPRILANVLLRNLLRDGRFLRLHLEIPDRPGVLADISTRVAAAGGNVIEVSHQRLFAAPSVQTAELELMVEVRDAVQGAAIVAALEAGDYVVRRG